MRKWIFSFVGSMAMMVPLTVTAQASTGFLSDPRAETLVEELVEFGLDPDKVRYWLSQGNYLESTTTNIAAPREQTSTYREYRPLFVAESTIRGGKEFMAEHAETLARVEAELGVDPKVVVAIIGVETRYGRLTGRDRVIDALGTLAFSDNRRNDYFYRELRALFRIAHEEQIDPLLLRGSYAGAMGVPQFMPSSYMAYAIDFNNDGKRDIWNNPVDAIGSVANYLAAHRWERDGPVAMRARVSGDDFEDIVANTRLQPHTSVADTLASGWEPIYDIDNDRMASTFRLDGEHGAEFWYGFNNLYVISRYNRSLSYAMAVYQLSQEFR
ncbi:lytic murein transglycosylase B [Salinispirillum sp. LH 10-3-1]|uniref:Lytic murein transglycosylase B n=1 Tax=Salinispirillum sp. LH 10-3-1 TaxID=2952525 RepID=A0AB38YHX5_9GAMM